MTGKSNNKKELIYRQVNNISSAEMSKPEHQLRMQKALEMLWKYEGLYPNETEELRKIRVGLEGPANDEALELAEHFKKLYPGEYDSMSGWTTIYTLYNRMKDLLSKGVEEVSEANAAEGTDGSGTDVASAAEVEKPKTQVEVQSSDINTNNKILNKEKENKVMANKNLNESLGKIDDLADETIKALGSNADDIESLGSDIEQGAKPSDASGATLDAARKVVQEAKEDRIQFTANSQITKIIFNSQKAVLRCVDGENAKGRIAEPAKRLQDFMTKLGVVEDKETGVVTFKNVVDGYEGAAREIYDILKSAESNPDAMYEVMFGKGLGSIKGVVLKRADSKESAVTTIPSLTNFLMTKTVFCVNSIVNGIQAKIGEARTTTSKSTAKPGKPKAADNAYKGTAVIRWANRADIENHSELIEYYKEINKDKHEFKKGLKSKLSCKYKNTAKVDANGNPRVVTYRIPLEVDQYETVITSDEMKAVWPEGMGVGHVEQPVDIADNAAMQAYMDEVMKIVAKAAEKNVGGEMFDQIREMAESSKNASDAEDAGNIAPDTAELGA